MCVAKKKKYLQLRSLSKENVCISMCVRQATVGKLPKVWVQTQTYRSCLTTSQREHFITILNRQSQCQRVKGTKAIICQEINKGGLEHEFACIIKDNKESRKDNISGQRGEQSRMGAGRMQVAGGVDRKSGGFRLDNHKQKELVIKIALNSISLIIILKFKRDSDLTDHSLSPTQFSALSASTIPKEKISNFCKTCLAESRRQKGQQYACESYIHNIF